MLEVLLGHVLWIEIRAKRFLRGNVWKERAILVDVGPGPFIDPEIVQPGLAERRRIELQSRIQEWIANPKLLHEDVVEDPRRLEQFDQRLAVSGGEAVDVDAERRWRKASRHLLELL